MERGEEFALAWARRRSGSIELMPGHQCQVMVDAQRRRSLTVTLQIDLTGLPRAETEVAVLSFLQAAGIETATSCKALNVYASGSQGADRTIELSEEIFWLPDARHIRSNRRQGGFEILAVHQFVGSNGPQRFLRVPMCNGSGEWVSVYIPAALFTRGVLNQHAVPPFALDAAVPDPFAEQRPAFLAGALADEVKALEETRYEQLVLSQETHLRQLEANRKQAEKDEVYAEAARLKAQRETQEQEARRVADVALAASNRIAQRAADAARKEEADAKAQVAALEAKHTAQISEDRRKARAQQNQLAAEETIRQAALATEKALQEAIAQTKREERARLQRAEAEAQTHAEAQRAAMEGEVVDAAPVANTVVPAPSGSPPPGPPAELDSEVEARSGAAASDDASADPVTGDPITPGVPDPEREGGGGGSDDVSERTDAATESEEEATLDGGGEGTFRSPKTRAEKATSGAQLRGRQSRAGKTVVQ